MDENSQPLKQFEGMPDPRSVPPPETKKPASFFSRAFTSPRPQTPAPTTPPATRPTKKEGLDIIYADDPIPLATVMPTAPKAPVFTPPPAPLPATPAPTAPATEFKAIVPDPIFARAGIKTSEQEAPENNVALETLGRNVAPPPAAATPAQPVQNRLNPSGIAPVFSTTQQAPSVTPQPTVAQAFTAATATPRPAPLTPKAAQTFRESQFAPAAPQPQNDDANIVKSLRTYERDVADSIRGGQTVMSINRAAQKQKEERHEISEQTEVVARNSLKTVISVVLILAAVATLGVVFFVGKQQAPVAPAVVVRTIVSVDNTRDVTISSTSRETFINNIKKVLQDTRDPGEGNQSVNKSLVALNLGKNITAETFFKSTATNIPASLIRAFNNEWLFGFQSLAHHEPFLIIGIDSFDNAYSGMLLWEQNMPTDLREIFLANNVAEVTSTVGTTTVKQKVAVPLKKQFEDKLVKSRDTRVLKNDQGDIVLLYSFIDTKYVVVTTNEDTFREIITRYLAAGLVR